MTTELILEDASEPASVALTLPDPERIETVRMVPQGFAIHYFAEHVNAASWEQLDEAEGRVARLCGITSEFQKDELELRKAWRLIEVRRGILLGVDRAPGGPTPENFQRPESLGMSPALASMCRKFARYSHVVFEHLDGATELRQVSQDAIKALIAEHEKREAGPERSKPSAEPSTNGKGPGAGTDDDAETASDAPLEVDGYDLADDAPDPVEEWERAEAENERLRARVESLSADDQGAELAKWQERYARLEGRLNQAVNEKNAAVRQARYQGDILGKLRRLLNCDSNGEIVGAITDLIQ